MFARALDSMARAHPDAAVRHRQLVAESVEPRLRQESCRLTRGGQAATDSFR